MGSGAQAGAIGYLGTTEGVTDDGRFVVLARFESKAAAAKNRARPAQGEWFAAMEKVVSDVTFHDCSRVETLFGGGENEATFVQVMQGRITDRAGWVFLRASVTSRAESLRTPATPSRSRGSRCVSEARQIATRFPQGTTPPQRKR